MQSAPTATETVTPIGNADVDHGRDGTVDVDAADPLVADELLIEEISIDGMCGVY